MPLRAEQLKIKLKNIRNYLREAPLIQKLAIFLTIGFLSLYQVSSAQAAESPIQDVLNLIQKSNIATDIQTINKSNDSNDTSNVPMQNNGQARNNSQNKKTIPGKPSPQEIEKAADFASQKTGVDKNFLMGELAVETSLGQNVGACTYKQVEDGAQQRYDRGSLSASSWDTFQQRKNIIEKLAGDLGYDPDDLRVSCNPPYTGTGGAMGVSQFMPDTWTSYEKRVEAIVNHVPDPWNVTDGVVALAVKLSDTPGVIQHNVLAERDAAKYYLSGSISSRYEWYANEVMYWAQNYSSLMS